LLFAASRDTAVIHDTVYQEKIPALASSLSILVALLGACAVPGEEFADPAALPGLAGMRPKKKS
jgi:hypothetical protein